ncbi:hypothetical protein F5144DRAFT_615250 [Chaetomium tenue]|uniref:Uncharacterized protein n=1 Tax=Chaetomium tenue TaxID=1854479 RepID=A0ACB7P0N6_9PEZI|nr:hypothetical protein F5144DRAFT_615250 [Chaetomium globosum]
MAAGKSAVPIVCRCQSAGLLGHWAPGQAAPRVNRGSIYNEDDQIIQCLTHGPISGGLWKLRFLPWVIQEREVKAIPLQYWAVWSFAQPSRTRPGREPALPRGPGEEDDDDDDDEEGENEDESEHGGKP